MTGRGQHGASHQHRVDRVQGGHRVTKIDRHALGEARRDLQDLAFTVGAGQVAVLQRRPRLPPVDRGHRLAVKAAAELDIDQEILADQPGPVADHQLDGRLAGQQPLCPGPKRGRQIIEARSVSRIPSSRSTMLS